MASSNTADLLGSFLGDSSIDAGHASRPLDGTQKFLLTATAIAAYAFAFVVFSLFGLPALPKVSALLLLGQPGYAIVVVWTVMVGLTLLARLTVGGVRYEAPVFCAAIGLLALPTHGGDFRNAALDAGSPTVFLRMIVELGLLTLAIAASYVALGVGRRRPELDPDDPANLPPAHTHPQDSAVDRLVAVGLQTLFVLALLALFGQSPLKGQAMLGLALAAGLASWIAFKTRQVESSVWPVAGTLLAGFIAYSWSYLHPDGLPLGDIQNALAGATYSLPLHYASAGVAGAIYGYWVARVGE